MPGTMERFAINILHKQIYKICRLCGVDNPIKFPIIEENAEEIIVGDDDEATLAKKIEECVGIQVTKDDKMPQNICSLCVDKISDFYEYRLMCAATNVQTRTILNLPLVEPSRKLLIGPGLTPKVDVKDVKEDVKIEAASSSSSKKGKKRRGPPSPSPSPAPTTRVKAPVDIVKDEPVPSTPVKALTKKERLKQQQQLLEKQKLEKEAAAAAEKEQKPTRSKRKEPSPPEGAPEPKLAAKPEVIVPVPKKIKFEHPCSFCTDEFKTQTELDGHLGTKHVPIVRKFGCGSCRETFESVLEFKDHNLWHQLTRTPYTCFKCKRKYDKNLALVKHVSLNACGRISRGRPPTVLPDVQCRLCNKKFKTQNLFEWHSCFLKPKSKCPKCDKYFVKKQILTRHYMMFCTGTLPPPEPLLIPKEEPAEPPAVNSKSGTAATAGTVAGNPERRTRRSVPAEPELPKEEREIPFPPPLDLAPETPAPAPAPAPASSTGSGKKRGRPKAVPVEVAPPVGAAEKIATLLDTGSKLDGDTDIATINNLLSSVTEAIASISEAKAKKKKKKKDKNKDKVRFADTPTEIPPPVDTPPVETPPVVTPPVEESSSSPVDTRTDEERQADAFAEQVGEMSMNEQLALCKMPMVVLAKTTFKQETTEIDTEPSQLQEPLGNGDDEDANDNDDYETPGFQDDADNGDEGDDDDQQETPAPSAEPTPEEIPFPMPIKQEEEPVEETTTESQPPVAEKEKPANKEPPAPTSQESLFNEQLALNIKREPGLEDEEPAAKRRRPESRSSVASPMSSLSSSSRSAAQSSPKPTLILKIKKEKGLLNASVREPIVVDDDDDDEAESQEKSRKTTYKKPNPLAVRVKQEKVDPAYEQQELVAAQNSELPGGIRIKQERIDPDDEMESGSPVEAQELEPARKKPRQAAPVIAFDGVRIKQEKPDHVASKPASPSVDSSKPAEKKKKSKVKINPFALLKQRMAAEAAAKSSASTGGGTPQQSASPLPVITNVVGNAPTSTASSSTRSSISADAEPESVPVIAQVQSIAPKETTPEVDFPMPIKQEPDEEEKTAPEEPADEEPDEFPMPIKEEAPEDEAKAASSPAESEEAEFPMPIKEEPEESQNGPAIVESPADEPVAKVEKEKEAAMEEKSEDSNEQLETPSPDWKQDESEAQPDKEAEEDSETSPPEDEKPTEEVTEKEPETSPTEDEKPVEEEASPTVEQASSDESPKKVENLPEEQPASTETQESAESSPAAEQTPLNETSADAETLPEANDDNEQQQQQEASEEVPAKDCEQPLEDIPEESTSPISDTPMDDYDQNSQEQEPVAAIGSEEPPTATEDNAPVESPKPDPAPMSVEEPVAKAPESEFEELQNLLTESLKPPDLDYPSQPESASSVPNADQTAGNDALDVDLDSLLNNKLDEISGAPRQHDDIQLAIERELLHEMLPPEDDALRTGLSSQMPNNSNSGSDNSGNPNNSLLDVSKDLLLEGNGPQQSS